MAPCSSGFGASSQSAYHRFQVTSNSVKTSFMMLLSLPQPVPRYNQRCNLALEELLPTSGEVVEVGICQTVSQGKAFFDEDRQTGVPNSR